MNSCRTLIVIDEAATLGKFDKVLDAIARMRGYGVQSWLFFQILSQTKVYGEKSEQIAGLAAVIQYFGGTADKATADKISELSGKRTIPVPGINVQFGEKAGGSNNSSLAGRDVIMPDEVARFPLPGQIVHYVGKGTALGTLFGPELDEFPDYWVFMQALEAGFPAEDAATYADTIPQRVAAEMAAQKPQSRLAKPARKGFTMPSLNPFKLIDKTIAGLLGHEDK